MKQKGFTLIELIVVVAIIGVLAGLLVPTLLGYTSKSKLNSANSCASSLYRAACSVITDSIDSPFADGTYSSSGAGGTEDTAFEAKLNEYYNGISNAYWGIRVSGDAIVATIYADHSGDPYIGAFPKATTGKTSGAPNLVSLLDSAED